MGESEVDLAAGFSIGAAYVRVLLRYADSLRLGAERRRTRWDGSGNPWNWLSTPAYRHVKDQGLDTIGSVRAALKAGSLRDQAKQPTTPRRATSAELWRWLTWVGPTQG